MRTNIFTLVLSATIILFSCGDSEPKQTLKAASPSKAVVKKEASNPLDDKGIGPVKSLVLPSEIDQTMVAEGKELFKAKCSACHKVSKRFIGPPVKGILERRSPEWTMNMILNPDEMVKKNPIAKKLLMEYSAPMANQSLTEPQARVILEYFRTLN